MQAAFFDSLLKALSTSRLAPYLHDDDEVSSLTPFSRYLWNTALSESLYCVLQGLEVTLRNSIHDSITRYLGREDWFEFILLESERKTLERVKERLKGQKKPLEMGQLVASSNFGFWVRLFNRPYENILWPDLLADVLPSMPRRIRPRKIILDRLYSIRRLRNRVFHFEPIWHWQSLNKQHDEIVETIAWINPSTAGFVRITDRFPETYSLGISGYEDLLSAHVRTLRPDSSN